jgi:branched-chain amino acid transport system substrate-binding protein
MRLRSVAIVAAGLVMVAAFAFAGGQGEGDTIKIGVAGPHSGDLAPYGLPTINAVELVTEKVNAEGGIDGRLIELVVEDDQCAPDVAANTAAKLVSDGVVAVIGHICSGATATALEIYLESDIVAISPSATNPGLRENENFFRTIGADDAQGPTQVDFVVDELGITSIALLNDKGDYGQGLSDFALVALQERGIEPVLNEGITVGAVDYSAIINRVAAEGAEAILWGGYHPEASKLVDQMRSRGLNIVFVGADGIYGNAIIDLAGEAAEGVYASGPTQPSGALAAEYTELHVEEYGTEPGDFFMQAVSAMLALVNAIDAADSTDYDAIVSALHSETVATPYGKIGFDDMGDATGVGFSIFQVQNGQYVTVGD